MTAPRAPVALLVFNRPEVTARVFARVRDARPPVLLVVADGPRRAVPGEADLCAAVRRVVEGVDWECDVRTDYAEENLGCRRRVSSGLQWVFETVEEAIILEDDCLPEPTFFPFAEELLARYRDDERVAMISGDNLNPRRPEREHSYYFSRYSHIWGWATWRRAWRSYDVEMKLWPAFRDGGFLEGMLDDPALVRYWREHFEAARSGRIDTWDYQWIFSTWAQSRLSVVPSRNLVTNIGFGSDATHTREPGPGANLPSEPMPFPLRHPPIVARDARADRAVERIQYGQRGFAEGTLDRARRVLRRATGR